MDSSMMKLPAIMTAALLIPVGSALAQTTATSDPSAALKPEQCGSIWDKSVVNGATERQAGAAEGLGPFALSDDIIQVDANQDGTIDRLEFAAACAKGLVYTPPRPKE
jgi:hypothetical protein